MKISLTEPACLELEDTIEYYDKEILGLGHKFYQELLSTFALIEKFPYIGSKNSKHTRKAILKIFPFNIIYTIWNKGIYIIAIAHQHREPDYWIERIEETLYLLSIPKMRESIQKGMKTPILECVKDLK